MELGTEAVLLGNALGRAARRPELATRRIQVSGDDVRAEVEHDEQCLLQREQLTVQRDLGVCPVITAEAGLKCSGHRGCVRRPVFCTAGWKYGFREDLKQEVGEADEVKLFRILRDWGDFKEVAGG